MDDGPVSPATQRWAARRVVEQHGQPGPGVTGRCAHCTDQGCRLLAQAIHLLKSNAPRFRPLQS